MMAVYRFHDVDPVRPPRASPGPAASESINSQIGRSLPLADAIPSGTPRVFPPALPSLPSPFVHKGENSVRDCETEAAALPTRSFAI